MTDKFKQSEIQESMARIELLSRRYERVCVKLMDSHGWERVRTEHILAMLESELAAEFWPTRHFFEELSQLSQELLHNLFS